MQGIKTERATNNTDNIASDDYLNTLVQQHFSIIAVKGNEKIANENYCNNPSSQ